MFSFVYSESALSGARETEERQAQDLECNVLIFWNEDWVPTYGANCATARVTQSAEGEYDLKPRTIDGRKEALYRQIRLRLQFTDRGAFNPNMPASTLRATANTSR